MDPNTINNDVSVSESENSRLSSNRLYEGNRWTPLLLLAAFVSTFGFALPVGYSLGVLNTPSEILKKWCNETLISEHKTILSIKEFELFWSLIVSVFLIGGVIGGLTGAWFADRLGRKGTLISGNLLNITSGILFLISKFMASVEMFFIGRVIVGFIAGLMTTVVPMYLTELSPPKFVGLMGVLFPAGLSFGILISQIIGLNWLLGTETLWPFLVSGYMVLAILVLLSIPWLPESPKYLYKICKEDDKAMKELSDLRNLPIDVVAWELSSDSSPRRSLQEKWNLVSVFATPRLRIPMLLVIALQAGQQFSGISAIFYYSSSIFKAANLDAQHIPYANIGTGVINFLIPTSGMVLNNIFGRKTLLILSCTLTSIMLTLLTISIHFMNFAMWVPYITIFLVLTFIFCYNLGLGPIPYFIGAELVDIGPRPVIMALGSVANWGGNFLIGVSFTSLHNWLHEYVFLIFASCTLLLMIVVALYLPETRVKSTHPDEASERIKM